MTIENLISILRTLPPDEEIFGHMLDSDGEPFILTVTGVEARSGMIMIDLDEDTPEDDDDENDDYFDDDDEDD